MAIFQNCSSAITHQWRRQGQKVNVLDAALAALVSSSVSSSVHPAISLLSPKAAAQHERFQQRNSFQSVS